MSDKLPPIRRHKASGQAVVYLNRTIHYLGPYKSAETKAEYDRVVAEWLASGRRAQDDGAPITVAEVVAAFRRHAGTYYRDAEGVLSRAVQNIDEALKPVVRLFGKTPAAEFGSLRLKAVRDTMIADGRVRTNVNRHITRIRGVFGWAVENELIPASVHHGLLAIKGLRRGRCEAQESDPVQHVPEAYVDAALPHVSRQVSAMIKLQLLTGMRPGEVVLMRGADLDTTGKLWVYRPEKHKTQSHGHAREIYLGPKAQAVIEPFLKTDVQAYLFSPADAERERREKMHLARKTLLSCGNVPGSNRKRKPGRVPGERYDPMTYYRAIVRGCDKANS